MTSENIYISTVCPQGERDLDKVLDRLSSLGIQKIELSAPHPYIEFGELYSLLLKHRNSGNQFIIHNYFPRPTTDFVLNIASTQADTQLACHNMVTEACLLAHKIDSPFYGVHAGYLSDADVTPDGMFSFDESKILSPTDAMGQVAMFINKITASINLPSQGLLLENLFPATSSKTFSLFSLSEEIDALFSAIENEKIGLLLDLAHLKITCNLLDRNPDKELDTILSKHGHRLRSLHLSDNDGQHDSHQPLSENGWPLQALRRFRGEKNITATLESRRMNDRTLVRQFELIQQQLC